MPSAKPMRIFLQAVSTAIASTIRGATVMAKAESGYTHHMQVLDRNG